MERLSRNRGPSSRFFVVIQTFIAAAVATGTLCSVLAVADVDSSSMAPAVAPISALNATTIKLGVFMESLCPDTRRFFRNQLLPTQRLIGEIIELDLVPFGHARVLGNGKMICQHGPRECEGNRRMACILVRSKNQTAVVETFGCLLRLDSSPKDCVRKNLPDLSFDELEQCTGGEESYQLMITAEKESGRLSYVPHITVDGKSNEEIQDQAENHLKDYMCRLYTGSMPLEACKSVTVTER